MQDKFVHFDETQEEIARDVFAIARIEALPAMLDLLCDITGMGFAAVARVSGATWTVCAVKDNIDFGLKVGDQLPVESTLCIESRRSGEPIMIDHASLDPRYCNHHTPRAYRIESYISFPIVLSNRYYFGNLCAVDPVPAKVSTPAMADIFKRFASLIAYHLASDDVIKRTDDDLVTERVTNDRRDAFLAELGTIMRSPLRAINNASNRIDREMNEPLAIKALATRIRTNALRISSLIENFGNFSRPMSATHLRPIDQPRYLMTGEDSETFFRLAGRPIERSGLESLLMQRVGELNAHLGRYDMYALTILAWLEGRRHFEPSIAVLNIRTRGEAISNHLQLLAVPESAIFEFDSIIKQLLSVLSRHEIAATKEAVIPALRADGMHTTTRVGVEPAWYDYRSASDEELQKSVATMEGDISLIASLYLRLAGWAGALTLLPCWH